MARFCVQLQLSLCLSASVAESIVTNVQQMPQSPYICDARIVLRYYGQSHNRKLGMHVGLVTAHDCLIDRQTLMIVD